MFSLNMFNSWFSHSVADAISKARLVEALDAILNRAAVSQYTLHVE